MFAPVIKSITINTNAQKVWDALTVPAFMQQWMSETPLDIKTDWQVGSPVIISGEWYKARFENKGVVVKCEKPYLLKYTHLNSLSKLPGNEEDFVVLEFAISPVAGANLLTLTASNFPTETIYRHVNFYWGVALHLLKQVAET